MIDDIDKEKIKNIFLGILGLLVFILGLMNIYFYSNNNGKEEEFINVKNNEVAAVKIDDENKCIDNNDNIKDYFYVDVKGAVKKPGVYEVSSGSIVNDVINQAGGLKSNASTKYLNMSKKLTEEMVIYVYTTTEVKNMDTQKIKEDCITDNSFVKECEGTSIVINKDSSPSNIDSNNSLININTAGLDALQTLTGIGEAKAKAIIEYRNSNGGFKKIEDIMNVSGIGEAAFAKIKDNITI